MDAHRARPEAHTFSAWGAAPETVTGSCACRIPRVTYFRTMTEEEFRKLEEELPAKAGEAFATARARTLAAGLSVVESRNGYIYEVFPDGREIVLKKIEPSRKFKAGQRFIIPQSLANEP